MDFVNKLTEQLRDIFMSMTAGARLTAALLIAVVGVAGVLAFSVSARTREVGSDAAHGR